MPCDTMRVPGQTAAQRVTQVRETIKLIDKLIAAQKVQVKVGPQGAVVFIGLSDTDRNRMTDACIYRMLSRSGSAVTRMAFARAEQIAGRSVDRKLVAAGIHSHNGGATWHPKG